MTGVKKNRMLKKFVYIVIILQAATCFALDAKVSVLYSSDIESFTETVKGFKAQLHTKGVNLKISEYSLSKIAPDAAVQQMIAETPNLVLAAGPQAAKIIKEKISSIPVIYCCVVDPREYSASNFTGAILDIPADIKLHALKKMLPKIKKIGLIYSDKTVSIFNEFSSVVGKYGFELLSQKVTTESDFANKFNSLTAADYCFIMIPDGVYSSQTIKLVLLEGLKNRFPVVGLSPFFTKAGALLSFDCDYEDHGKQVAEIALSILNGAKPSDIKPVRPKKIKYTLNMAIAAKIGVDIAPNTEEEASAVFR